MANRPKLKKRRPIYYQQGDSIDRYSLREVGLNNLALAIIGFIAILPFAGLIVGAYYARQSHSETRSMGRLLFSFSIILHFVYACFLCPALLYLSLGNFF